MATSGSVADSHDNATAEALSVDFKAEPVRWQTWRTCDQVEYSIVGWIG